MSVPPAAMLPPPTTFDPSLFSGVNALPLPPTPAVTAPEAPAASAPPTPAEKKGIWATFLGHLQNNPDLAQTLLHFAAAVAQPRQLGQNTLSVAANALAGSADYFKGLKQQEQQKQIQQQLFDLKKRQVDIEQQQADTGTAAQNLTATQMQAKQTLAEKQYNLDSKKATNEAALQKAQSNYYNAMAQAAGQNKDGGARLEMANELAQSYLATGKFKDKSQAFMAAVDTVLHTQGQTPEQMFQTLRTKAVEGVTALPGATPDKINAAWHSIDSLEQEFYKVHGGGPDTTATPGTPPAGAPAADPVTARFESDPKTAAYVKQGYKLGPMVPGKGRTVLDPNGQPTGAYYN